MKKITADNRREICDKERECLTRKQELLRGGCQRVGRFFFILKPNSILQGKTWGQPLLKSAVRLKYQLSPTLLDIIPDVEERSKQVK